jgi:hypothetical protein
MIDYAHPTMMAEKALKDLHNAMLDKKYSEAIEHGIKALVETRMALNAIKHTMETQNETQ